MPEISRFLGIVIAIYWQVHGVPHFHAKYGSQRASFKKPLRPIDPLA